MVLIIIKTIIKMLDILQLKVLSKNKKSLNLYLSITISLLQIGTQTSLKSR